MESFIFCRVLEKYEISREPLKRMELKKSPQLITQNKKFEFGTENCTKLAIELSIESPILLDLVKWSHTIREGVMI